MDDLTITFAQYGVIEGNITCITAIIDGVTMSVPLDPANRHYAEIMRQVEAGELTIQPADQ
jgi:hypothetical protein